MDGAGKQQAIHDQVIGFLPICGMAYPCRGDPTSAAISPNEAPPTMISAARRFSVAIALLAVASPRSAKAQLATQTVGFAVNAINVIAFTGSPSMTIITALAGSNPTTVTNATARWAVTTNQTGAKITASIPTNVPTGLTLSVSLQAPTGGVSLGFKALTTATVDLVTGVTKRNQINRTVSYRLAATPAGGVIASTTRVVTYTITGGT